MHSTIRLFVFLAAAAILLFFSQPVLSQQKTPVLTQEMTELEEADNEEAFDGLLSVITRRQTPELEQGIADFKLENYEEALDSLLIAREIEPNSSIAAYFLGITYKNLQGYNEADVHLSDAVSLEPKVREAVLELAEVHLQLGKLKEAMDAIAIAERESIGPGQTAFLKGLILIKMNENFAAVESFKKAGELSPELVQPSEYQIGLAYMKGGRLEEAKKQFKEIIIKDPNTDMAAFASQYIDAIERKIEAERPLRFSLGLSFQYDDNVLLKPGDAAVAAGITDEDDSREVVTAKIEYVPKVEGPWGFKAQYSFYLSSHHDLSTNDVMSHTVALVPSYSFKINMLSFLLSQNYTLVDDKEYLSTTTMSPTLALSLGSKQVLQASLKYQRKEFLGETIDIDEDRDADDYGLSLSWLYLFAKNKGFFSLRYALNKEDADGQNWDYIGNKGNVTLLVPFKKKFRFNVSGETYYQGFENVHSIFGKKRKDTTYTVSTLLSWKLYKKTNLTFQHAYIRGDSSIAIYDYEKNIYSIGLEWKY